MNSGGGENLTLFLSFTVFTLSTGLHRSITLHAFVSLSLVVNFVNVLIVLSCRYVFIIQIGSQGFTGSIVINPLATRHPILDKVL